MKQKFIDTLKNNVHREGLDSLLDWLESTDFYRAPASSMFHCNYEGGLVEHSLNVYNTLVSSPFLKDYSD